MAEVDEAEEPVAEEPEAEEPEAEAEPDETEGAQPSHVVEEQEPAAETASMAGDKGIRRRWPLRLRGRRSGR